MSYGYVEIGLCHRCSTPDHLFVYSNHEHGVNQSARCSGCHSFSSLEGAPNRVPIMDEVPNCEACGKPELIFEGESDDESQRWQFIEAYLADGERAIIAHRECTTSRRHSSSCVDCNTVYATTRHRDWRMISPIAFTEFSELLQIEGDLRCTKCATAYYEENGGESNFNSCESCDDIFHRDNGGWFSDCLYCQNCLDNYVYECDNCGTEYWDGNGHDCSEDEDESTIHSYSYRPSPYFFGKGQYYLGFELEVEARNESRYAGAEIAQDLLGSHAYMKDDGSLSDGFEIVTHPHTLEAYQTDFNWEFIPTLKRNGFRSWNTETCGLHVHVSRTAFGDGLIPWNSTDRDQLILKKQAHELRFMKLIYDNQRQVERIAGRAGNHYATFQDKGKLVSKLKYGNQSSGRYSAINTENDATLEVRVFKGSLRKERVMSALEFVTASVEYTRDLKVTAKNQALSWLRFTAYVSEHMDTYPNLALIMSESFASDTNPNEN